MDTVLHTESKHTQLQLIEYAIWTIYYVIK